MRAEGPADLRRVLTIQRDAFGREDEARLVERLRESASPALSLVAESDAGVVGHVFLSPVTIEGAPGAPSCAGLAPLAVAPDAQARGAGSALVREALRACPELGWRAVFLLGDPGYYARFGFRLCAPRGLRYESEAFDRGFQAIELVPRTLDGCRGLVRYHEAFDALGA